MAFFNSAITVLQTLVIALGAGLGVWGVINLLEGYGNDNPGANAYGYAPDTGLRMSGEKLRKLGWRPRKALQEMYRDVIGNSK